MLLSYDKCLIISFSRKTNPIFFSYYFTVDNLCNRVFDVKDLGVIFNKKMTFNKHIDNVILRCNRIWGFIVRNTKNFKSTDAIRCLYVSLVKSIIMYGSPIWRPYKKFNINKLERLQHKAIDYLAYKSGNPMDIFDHSYTIVSEPFHLGTVKSTMIAADYILLIISKNNYCPTLYSEIPVNNSEYKLRNDTPFLLRNSSTIIYN